MQQKKNTLHPYVRHKKDDTTLVYIKCVNVIQYVMFLYPRYRLEWKENKKVQHTFNARICVSRNAIHIKKPPIFSFPFWRYGGYGGEKKKSFFPWLKNNFNFSTTQCPSLLEIS